MSAREAILGRLARPVPADLARQAAALVVDPERPPIAPGDIADRFVAQLAMPSVAATVDRIGSLSHLPAAVTAYLDHHRLPRALYLPPDPVLTMCDWHGFSISDAAASDQNAALAGAIAGVAETGSLIFATTPNAPMLPNFLTLHHLVVLQRNRLVETLEDAPRDLPNARALYWVTGVSGTTDIEGQYVRGAHGPRFLHVFLVG